MTRLRSLPAQLFALTILPLTLALVLIAFGGLTLHQRAMRQMVGERDERAIRAAATAMTEQLNRRASAVLGLALHSRHNGPSTALADSAAFRGDFESLALFDLEGALLASEHPEWWERMARVNLLQEQPVIAGDPLFLPMTTDPETGRPVIIILATTEDGAVAAGALDPAEIARDALSRVVLPGDHTTAYVVRPDGTLFYQIGEDYHSEPIGDHPGVAEALRGEFGTTYMQVGGDEHVISHTPVAPVGWALVMEEPWREMASPMLRWTELAPFVLLPAVAFSMAGLWFALRQIVNPLQALAAKTTALGQGDFGSVRTPVGGIAEIRQLQGELIGMARRLQLAQQGLRDYLGALTEGQEEERRRLARELHDDTIQSLIALNQRIQLAQTHASDPRELAQLAEMEQLATATIGDLRRMTRDLRPSYLDDLGLTPALELLARDQSREMDIPVTFTTNGDTRRLSPEVELAFYRIAQEALRNAGRHAQASAVAMTLGFSSEGAYLAIADDGQGFDTSQRLSELAHGGHFGLLGARERAQAVGARLTVESTPGKGTLVRLDLEGQ